MQAAKIKILWMNCNTTAMNVALTAWHRQKHFLSNVRQFYRNLLYFCAPKTYSVLGNHL